MRKTEIIGNITRDAEVRTLTSGRSVINFDLATTEKWKDKNSGEKKEKTYYTKCALWRDKTAIAQYLTKGVKLYVEGSPEVEAWINQEGKAVGNVKINVREIEFLGGGKKNENATVAPASNSVETSEGTLVPTPDSDLPF